MKQLLYATTALLGLAIAPANAALQISADINGTIVSCVDQASCDTNFALGQLSIADQIIGGVQFLGSAQTQVIGPTNSLNTSSFQIINNNATSVPIAVAISGTDFQGPVSVFSASGSGTFQSAVGSSATLTFWGDTANTQGANSPTDLPGTQLATMSKTALSATDSFSQNFSGSFVDLDFYSMSLGTSGILTAGGSLVGRSQAVVTEQDVPEPAGLAVLGLGLTAMGAVRYRRRQGSAS